VLSHATAYHHELASRLRRILDDQLVGVYATGSYALGDYDPRRSDLDVVAVCRGSLSTEQKEAVVAAVRHESLPCPARGLEFVVYPERTVRMPTDRAGFELNVNTGPKIGFRVDFAPGDVERHWFPLDRAIAASRGTVIDGPPVEELFAPMPRDVLLPVIRESLEWHKRRDVGGDDDAVLNTCRTLRFLTDGVWTSKGEAGTWALDHVADRALVEAALASRNRSAELGRDRVEALIDDVLARAVQLESDSP
jgi:Domain of unknown function (DUF4111)/Nucleotidyltransferase domain